MNEINYLKIGSIAAFFAFAGVSCWATAESLHLLLSTWPISVCWIVTVGFFIIASIGTKMIVDSLNQNIYIENRGTRLCLGILIVIVFWLICSMPTNTHTFMFRSIVDDEFTTDVVTTRSYLGQVINNTNNKTQAQLQCNSLDNKVEAKLGELESEIKNEANPGFGTKSKAILNEFATMLNVAKVEPLTFKGTSIQDRNKLCDAYRQKILMLADTRKKVISNSILSPNSDNLKKVKASDKNLELTKKYVSENTLDLNNAEDLDQICNNLNDGYNNVKVNKEFVNFTSKEDEEKYTSPSPVSNVKKLVSVFDVWSDFFAGKYAGRGFAFWIVISILVDVAAFVFFDIAFKKNDF